MLIESDKIISAIRQYKGRWKHIPPDNILDICISVIELEVSRADLASTKSKLDNLTKPKTIDEAIPQHA